MIWQILFTLLSPDFIIYMPYVILPIKKKSLHVRSMNLDKGSALEVLTKPRYYIPSPNTNTVIPKYLKYRLYRKGQLSKIQGCIIKINYVYKLSENIFLSHLLNTLSYLIVMHFLYILHHFKNISNKGFWR